MKERVIRFAPVVLAFALTGCIPTYTLVPSGPVAVANKTMNVAPSNAWNRIPRGPSQLKFEEAWTRNGPVLDAITFMGGIADGEELAKYNRNEERRIPVFKTNMVPPDFVSMIESNYRIRAGVTVFEMTRLTPTDFLGTTGLQMDYDYVGADDVKRKGRTVLAVVEDKLYMMSLDGTALHYYDAALPEFESMTRQAALQ